MHDEARTAHDARSDLNCPHCGSRGSKVIDSRGERTGTHIRRRRACLACEKRFTTAEILSERAGRVLEIRRRIAAVLVTLQRAMTE